MKKLRINSTFAKMTIAFVLLGMVPMLLIGRVFFARYSKNVESVMLNYLEQISYYVAKNVEEIIYSVDSELSGVYVYTFGGESYLYEILKSADLSLQEKRSQINTMLNQMVNNSEYISSVRFLTADNQVYVYYRGSKNLKRGVGTANEITNITVDQYRSLFILPAFYESRYCTNSDDYMFTIARNYMDSSSLERNRTSILGTFYADIDVQTIGKLVERAEASKMGQIYVVNMDSQECLYSSDPEEYEKFMRWLTPYRGSITEKQGYIKAGKEYIVFSRVGNSQCYVIERVARDMIMDSYFRNRSYMILILFFSIFAIGSIYILFTRKLSEPVREMKRAMEKLQTGDLSARVAITSHDEMQYLGEGFNRMAEDLNVYIDQAYKARLEQKEAELDALKMQIQPHYLYNTLDVIRMKAMEHEDYQVAELIECLSRQLRYLTSSEQEVVTLRQELDNIREYFTIISIRYNGLYHLEIMASDEELKLYIPKLILQPIVENAVKHGLRGRKGPGKVMVSVTRKSSYLEILIMDNGIGISEEACTALNESLRSEKAGKDGIDHGIGIKNVYDRIRYLYGDEYGFTISGCDGIGVVVSFKLPVLEEKDEVESSNCG